MMGYYGNYSYGYGHPGLGLLGMILNVAFWVLVIVLIVRLVRGGGWRNRNMNWKDMMGGKSALDILKERYAKGEINRIEFEEKKKDLI